MYKYTDKQRKFIDKWVRGMMDIQGEYVLLEPTFKDNIPKCQAFICIDIKSPQGFYKFRTGLNLKMLEFIVNEYIR